ncbi:MAG: winged helix-turn-helix transcriptional regulator [Caulobacteraceae bacterium]|nr:winged helix-turn-helix transcriptional regulator [Caulobacteraceae bacterium]
MNAERMAGHAHEASELLKAVAHEGRLMVVCALLHGEKSVGELEALLSRRQAPVSQQLARLRLKGLFPPAGTAERSMTLSQMIGSARSSALYVPPFGGARLMSKKAGRTVWPGTHDVA